MADNSFTFWGNMKEAIDVYEGNPVYQYRMYDALTEYALYGIWPEDDGTMESKNLIMFVQSMVPSIEKSSNYVKKCAEKGSVGGRKQKISDDQIENAIKVAIKYFILDTLTPESSWIMDIDPDLPAVKTFAYSIINYKLLK